MVRKASLALGLALSAVTLMPTSEAQGAPGITARSSAPFAGSFAGRLSVPVQRRFHHGVVQRFATGMRHVGGFHRVTNVTMKRGIVRAAQPAPTSGQATGKRRRTLIWPSYPYN
jgi:hypothetical protein